MGEQIGGGKKGKNSFRNKFRMRKKTSSKEERFFFRW